MGRPPDRLEDTANKILKDFRILIGKAIAFYSNVPENKDTRMFHFFELLLFSSWIFLTLGLIFYMMRW